MAGGYSTNYVRVRRNDGVDTTNGHETWTYFDGLGRACQVREEAEANGFRVTDTAYDKRGNVTFVALPYFSSGTNYTRPASSELGAYHEYDPVSRLAKLTSGETGSFNNGQFTGATPTYGDTGSPLGSAQIAYNDGTDPWTLVLTDELGKVHKFVLDAYGRTNRIVEMVGTNSFTTRLGYNLAGDLTNITDSANNQIQYAYNDAGQLVATADPDMGVWQYQRDYAGRLRVQIDANGQQVHFNYETNLLGRLLSRQAYDFQSNLVYSVTNVYDTSDDANFTVYAGQLYKVIDNEGWQKNGYDLRGRTLKSARYLSKNGSTYTNQFAYDDSDRVTQTMYPAGGPTVTNIYDTGGNLSQVKQVGGGGTVFYAARGFDARGQLLGINFGNGVVTTNDYFANSLRLRRVVTYKTGSTNIQNLSYFYDQVSNLKGIADGVYGDGASAAITNIIYDDLHRLTSLTRTASGQTTSFSYDSIGNIKTNGENGLGSYDYGLRMPHAVKSANGVQYAYDANGNMLVRGNQRLAYDPENRLMYVVTATSAVTFGYDAGGARLWKQSTNGLQVWIDGNYEEKLGKVLYHILTGGMLVCTFDSTGTNVFQYYHPDHLHSTSVETDQNGARIQHYEYMVFGQDRFTESSITFPASKRFTSQILDEDTGLYFYGARYYDPVLGRFIQPDLTIPSLWNPQHLNRYCYVLNNPLKYADPSGHAPEWIRNELNKYYGKAQGTLDAAVGLVRATSWALSANAGIGFTSGLQNQLIDRGANLAQAGLDKAAGIVGARNDNMTFVANAAAAEIQANVATLFVGGGEAQALSKSAQVLTREAGALETGVAAEGTTLAVGRSNIRWVSENASMGEAARAYESGAAGAQKGMAPALVGPGGNLVKFDGFEGSVLIDRKVSVTTFPKSQYQAFRQSQALQANGFTGRWEVPTQAEANRATTMFNQRGINNISVLVVPK